MEEFDTIIACSTPLTPSAIAIVRMSGSESLRIAREIFRPSDITPRRAIFGSVVDGNDVIDTGILIYFEAPNSYTGEDVVELSIHGSPVVVDRVLKICIERGARPAERGEFTKRAYLNGKIDLAQAEAVAVLINAKTEKGAELAVKTLMGGLSKLVYNVEEDIKDVLAEVEASIDFPEYVDVTDEDIRRKIFDVKRRVDELIARWDMNRAIFDGLRVSIVGKPNVGKSTLFNRLVGSERAIVTEIPGTTRDFIEAEVLIDGVPVILVDTAGIRKHTDEPVEKIGIERTKDCISRSDFVIAVFDASCEHDEDDNEVLKALEGKNFIAVLNKSDLPRKSSLDIEFSISAKTGEGVEKLRSLIVENFKTAQTDVVPITSRQASAFRRAAKSLEKALVFSKQSVFIGMSFELRDALDSLAEITGRKLSDEVIEAIFSKFCIGK